MFLQEELAYRFLNVLWQEFSNYYEETDIDTCLQTFSKDEHLSVTTIFTLLNVKHLVKWVFYVKYIVVVFSWCLFCLARLCQEMHLTVENVSMKEKETHTHTHTHVFVKIAWISVKLISTEWLNKNDTKKI